ncbi:MAG: hypothetical protein WD534_16215 [Phycisphaeraceae bacterium]
MRIPRLAWGRLALLVAIVAVIAGSVTALHYHRQAELARTIADHREQAMAAAEAGRPHVALEHFAWYLAYHNDDAEALYQRAQMKLAAEPTEPEATREAVANLRRVLQLQPDHPTAERELLELYHRLGDHASVRRLAERRVRADPDDLPSARAYAAALAQLGEAREALRAAEAFLRHYGDDWRLHMLALELRRERGEPVEALLDEARALQAEHDEQPGYALLLARLLRQAGRADEAAPWLEQVARARPADASFARLALATMDEAEAYAMGLAYLARWSDELDHDAMRRELAWRLFEAGRFTDLAQRFAGREADDPTLDADRLALWALASYELGDVEQAHELAEAMSRREEDRRARAWVAALRAGRPGDASELGAVVASLLAALEITAQQPFFWALLGEAYATGEEHEFALDTWRYVASLRPSWSTPHVRMAELHLAMGKPDEAIGAARAALTRQPGSVSGAVVLARAWHVHIDAGESDNVAGLFDFLDQVQQVTPGEPATALIRFDRLARLERLDEARSWVRTLLAQPRFVSDSEAMLELLRAVREQTPAVTDELRQAYVAHHGRTAELALADALAEGEAEADAARAERVWARHAEEAGADMEELAWQWARARYLEAVAADAAGEAWAELADAHPAHIAVQLDALGSEATWVHRGAVDRAIDRVAEAMGEATLNWRVARARWLLEADDATRRAGRAISLLADVKEAAPHRLAVRLLLAEAHRVDGRPELALDELREAVQREPASLDLRLSLAELYHDQQQRASARQQATVVARDERASADQRERAAAVLEAIARAEEEG